MSFFKPANAAEACDSFLTLTAYGTAIVSLLYITSIAQEFVTPATADVIDLVQDGFAVLILIVGIPAFIRFEVVRSFSRTCRGEPESYIVDIFRKAGANAFSAAFVMMIAADVLSRTLLADQAASTLIQGVLAISLAVLSGNFFFFKLRDDLAGDLNGEEE